MGTRLFEAAKHAELYARFRPKYGKSVYDAIIDFCKSGKCDFDLAVDVGCGSGQSTTPLCSSFKHVIGLDVSPKQIEKAPKSVKNLTFRVSPAEDLSFLSNNSTDLITISQAIHWVDTNKFYKEVTRVLKPGGSLVVYGYGLNTMDNVEAQAELDKFYNGTLGNYWDEKRKHIECHYRDYSLPFGGWIRNDDLNITVEWGVDEFVGYLSTWSAWHSYLKEYPTSNELQKLSDRFKDLYTVKDESGAEEEKTIQIVWPVFMLMGHKPVS
ncbi:putative methyltransferase DDB_G0268948 [Patella vulgata]|uniref:putative methyltransferase DDB_G0268948 n=1 Tax=Patella vulgata TaxID=6465 RepID=UPI0024A98B59|nr:putative methyltransferase DDB_G0268948 [Patella vulgata]